MATKESVLGELLTSFTRSAWRLEALDRYEEDDACRAYFRGEPQSPPDPDFDAYLDNVRGMAAQGRQIGRVHAIVGPLTPYLRYEIEWGYALSEPAGEDVRILYRPTWKETSFQHQPPDFWVFDDETVARMRYGPDGEWLALDVIEEPTEVAVYLRLRALAIDHAVPLREYLALMRQAPLTPSVSLADLQRIAS